MARSRAFLSLFFRLWRNWAVGATMSSQVQTRRQPMMKIVIPMASAPSPVISGVVTGHRTDVSMSRVKRHMTTEGPVMRMGISR